MHRRSFSTAVAAAGIAAFVTRGARAADAGEAGAVSTDAAALYRQALVIDANLAPTDDDIPSLPMPQAALDRVRESGVSVVKWSLGGFDWGFEQTVTQIAAVQQMCERHPAYFTQVRGADDLHRAKREGRLGLILSFESVQMLEGRLDRLDLFRNLGVRVMQLSYNRRSPFANGVMEDKAQGLTPLGREAVAHMNALGIAIDLSHANEATTSEVIALSSRPPLITHGGCAAVHPHPRNKTDAQLRALAARGGVIGIYDLMYLAPSPRQPTLDDYLQHMVHALDVAGEDHVGVGSDAAIAPFDTSAQNLAEWQRLIAQRRQAGVAAPEEDRPPYTEGLNLPRRMERIADALLRRGYAQSTVEKVLGGNFARALSQNWAGA